MEEEYVRVASTNAPDDFMEFPLERDGTLTLSTVQSHFPNAIGLKYKAESGAWRGLRAVDNIFDPPRSGWSDLTYFITESESQNTRKSSYEKTDDAKVKKNLASGPNLLLQDMCVLSLPWTITNDELKEYFEETCGDVSYAEVKIDRETGKSRGFGFIRFETEDGAREALTQEHLLGGRMLQVKQKKDTPMKLFVGRLSSGTSESDLKGYFSQFGDVNDAYVPDPFRGFGFVTFASSDVGSRVVNAQHVMGDAVLNIAKAEQSKTFNKNRKKLGNITDDKASEQDKSNNNNNFVNNAIRKLNEQTNPKSDGKGKSGELDNSELGILLYMALLTV